MTTPDLLPVLASVGALPALPPDEPGDRYGLRALTAAWLLQYSSLHTRKAYFTDLARWLAWCEAESVNPLNAWPADITRFAAGIGILRDSSLHRKLSALSSWYIFLARNGKETTNPVAGVRRPTVDRDESSTVGLTVDEVRAMMRVADQIVKAAEGAHHNRLLVAHRNRLLLRLLADLGLRRSEAIGLDLASLGYNRGFRTIRFLGKGSKEHERPLSAHVCEALDAYLPVRGDAAGPLLVTLKIGGGFGRLDVKNVWRYVRKMATAAGIPGADRISPHSFRHAFATNSLDMDTPLTDVQDAMGHKDPRTTRRYDRGRRKLQRDPALRLGEQYMDREEGE